MITHSTRNWRVHWNILGSRRCWPHLRVGLRNCYWRNKSHWIRASQHVHRRLMSTFLEPFGEPIISKVLVKTFYALSLKRQFNQNRYFIHLLLTTLVTYFNQSSRFGVLAKLWTSAASPGVSLRECDTTANVYVLQGLSENIFIKYFQML